MTDIETAAVALFEHLDLTPERGTVLTTADSILLWIDGDTRDLPDVPATWRGYPVTRQRRPRARALTAR